MANWRQQLILRFQERDSNEVQKYKDIILQNNRLMDNVAQLKADKLRISVENEQLRSAVANNTGPAGNLAFLTLEKKLLSQQEELTELHKRKGENSQRIVDLNIRIEELNAQMNDKDRQLAQEKRSNASFRAEIKMYVSSMDELKRLNTTLKDEHTALQLAFSSLEEKLRSVQEENYNLLERLKDYKSRDADKLNEENESFLRKRSDKVRRELEDAVRETSRNSSSPISSEAIDCTNGIDISGIDCDLHIPPMSMNPTNMYAKFEAHEGEVSAVRWCPTEKIIATGGADRKLKLWDVRKRSPEQLAVLTGCSQGINSIDFDSTGTYVIGTSNDKGVRVWTVADHRLRHTLTGHIEKVMAAKYLHEPYKIISGSHDRTLKVWDVRSSACIETKFVGSSCFDLVTTDSIGASIISAHFDKKIRFWDIRMEKPINDLLLPNKITSLDLSKDCNFLLCSVRDDTIKLLDLRMNNILRTFSHENFKLSCDSARVGFNFDATRIASGSADGSIYIWNTLNGRHEELLKGHSPSAVNAVSWSPTQSSLASVGKGRRCIVWTAEL
ncbi:ATG16L1 family protein [Megaselia abdita]